MNKGHFFHSVANEFLRTLIILARFKRIYFLEGKKLSRILINQTWYLLK